MTETFFTSGTSGRRKPFALTDEQRNARAQRRAAAKGPEYAQIKSLFCGLKNTAGDGHRLYCDRNKLKFYEPTGNFEATIALFNAEQPDGIVSSPSELLKYARAEKRTHRFKYILASGSPLKPDVAKEILDTLLAADGVAYVSYGASEVGSIARGTFVDAIDISGCVGKVLDGVTLEVDGGQVRVKVEPKSGAISGYANKKLTDKHFKDGWFYPGDRAELTREGSLILKGRT